MPRLGKEWEEKRVKAVVSAVRTHGMSGTRIYNIWVRMKGRCLNKNDTRFYDYGGRGISVQESWKKFENFYADMRNTYNDSLTLERKDNNKGYSKENCCWVPAAKQQSNTRKNVHITHLGKTQTALQWSRELGIPSSTIYKRINRSGWNPVDALCTENKKGRKNLAV